MFKGWLNLKEKIANATTKYTGNKDFLEAVCAAAALTAAADGDVQDSEIASAIEAVKNHKGLSAAFKSREIETCMDNMLRQAKTRVGRMSLSRELGDVRDIGDHQMSEDVWLIAADVAAADGNVSADEEVVLKKIAGALGVDTSKLDF